MIYILCFLAFIYVSTGAIIGIRLVLPLPFKKKLGKVIIMIIAVVGYGLLWISLLLSDAIVNNVKSSKN